MVAQLLLTRYLNILTVRSGLKMETQLRKGRKIQYKKLDFQICKLKISKCKKSV